MQGDAYLHILTGVMGFLARFQGDTHRNRTRLFIKQMMLLYNCPAMPVSTYIDLRRHSGFNILGLNRRQVRFHPELVFIGDQEQAPACFNMLPDTEIITHYRTGDRCIKPKFPKRTFQFASGDCINLPVIQTVGAQFKPGLLISHFGFDIAFGADRFLTQSTHPLPLG